jgi:hypothetical protein
VGSGTPSATGHLYLTPAEADRLADHIGKELVCRTAAQANQPIMVADISLTAAEAWQLIDRLEGFLIEGKNDWPTEGF